VELASNRSKGQNAYVAPLDFKGSPDLSRAVFPKPQKGQEQNSYKGKFFTGEVDESKLADGWYQYKEAVFQSTKSSYGFIKIQSGEITEEASSVDEVIISKVNQIWPSLPPLVGSEKQTLWAEKIRAAILLECYERGYVHGDSPNDIALSNSPCEAKWWIECGGYAALRDWFNVRSSLSRVL
jgi:hypothetical protein